MNSNTRRYLHLPHAWPVPLALIGAAATLQLLGAQHLLRYDRTAVTAGEWWRLLTGNLVHLGWNHFILNEAALVLLWIIFGDRYTQRQWLQIIPIGMLSVGIGLYLFDTGIEWYVGLSGLLHCIYTAGAVALARTERRQAALMLLLVAGKLALEQSHGALSATVTLIGGAVVVDAHLYGACAGLVLGLFYLTRTRSG